MSILIRNGYVINPADQTESIMDILIIDGIIVERKPHIDIDCDITHASHGIKIIDAKGRYCMPGFVDLHAHLREPGYEYKETVRTGTMAAAAGGFTTICAMPNTFPITDDRDKVEVLLDVIKRDSIVNVIPIGAVTKDQAGEELSDIRGMKEAGIMAISEDGKSVMHSMLYKQAMLLAGDTGLAVFAHCEDLELAGGGVMNEGKRARELGMTGICNASESVVMARDILLAKETGAKLHLCHCSTAEGVALARFGKALGIGVTAEACPHHFSLTDDDIPCDDANYKMNPPLRGRADREALIEGLRTGVIDVIATDHAPHGEEEKKRSMREAPFGITGLETAFALTMTHLVKKGFITPMQMVEKLSYNPSKILSIPKGNLAKGGVADIVIADQDMEYVIDSGRFHSKGRNTPFDGHRVSGKVLLTMVGGRIAYREGI